MKKITLTQNKFALVDNDNFDKLLNYRWYAALDGSRGYYYAVRKERRDGRQITVRMHRQITNALDGMVVDHIDGNTLNNQKNNLRICTQMQNSWNRKVRQDNKSGFKGIEQYRRGDGWVARIVVNGTRKYLGSFKDKREAAIAYNQAAEKFFGRFALLN